MERDKHFLALVIVAILLELIGALNLFVPINTEVNARLADSLSGLQGFSNDLVSFGDSLANLSSLAEENSRLQADLASMQQQLAVYEQLQQLQEYIDAYSAESSYQVVNPAATSAEGYFYIFTGGDTEVTSGSLVVRGEYLIGIVDVVAKNYSRVQTILSPNSSIPVRVGDYLGTAIGLASTALSVDDLDAEAVVKVGDTVWGYSSAQMPLLGKYRLGEVSEILSADQVKQKSVLIESPVQINTLNYVEVIVQ